MIPPTMTWRGDALDLLDQLRLPHDEVYLACHDEVAVATAIRDMVVRGAPAIGVAAAFGMALAARGCLGAPRSTVDSHLARAAAHLAAARPTAVNLFWAIARMQRRAAATPGDGAAVAAALAAEAVAMHDEDIRINEAIGAFGQAVIPPGARVLTHCNAGALATVAYGTALGVIRAAHARGDGIRVWVDETRPYLQGARLTAWELLRDGIPATLICDNMAAHFMGRGEVDVIVTGADRIAANGDTANKIGTYGLAVLAKYHGLPFYIAAPRSTFDATLADGRAIPIEERPAGEVTTLAGQAIAPAGMPAAHPAFDVTPAALITGIITEGGILRPPYEAAIATALGGNVPASSPA